MFGVRTSGERTRVVRSKGTGGGEGEPGGRKRGRPLTPSKRRERAENCSRHPRNTPAKLPRRAPQEPSSAPGAPAEPSGARSLPPPAPARAELGGCACGRSTSPPLAESILLRCRSRAGSGSPCPAGGGTQARSPARGSPGERRAGSILSGSHGPASTLGEETAPRAAPPPPAAPVPSAPAPARRPAA